MSMYVRVRMWNGDTYTVEQMGEEDALGLVEDFQDPEQLVVSLALEVAPGKPNYLVHLSRAQMSSVEVGEN